jgi:hypothetical protein
MRLWNRLRLWGLTVRSPLMILWDRRLRMRLWNRLRLWGLTLRLDPLNLWGR